MKNERILIFGCFIFVMITALCVLLTFTAGTKVKAPFYEFKIRPGMENLIKLRSLEEKELSYSRPVDIRNDIYQIPIEWAIDLYVREKSRKNSND